MDHVDVGGVDDDGSSGSNGLRHSSQPSRPTRQFDDPLQSIGGPMTRSRTKKIQQALNQFIEGVVVRDSSLKTSDMDKVVYVLSIN